jgi:hypothetical protein
METNKKTETVKSPTGVEDFFTSSERLIKMFHMLKKDGIISPSETLIVSKEMSNLAKTQSSSSKDK